MHSDAVTAEAALTKNMYKPEAARDWTLERSWIVPEGFGKTTRGCDGEVWGMSRLDDPRAVDAAVLNDEQGAGGRAEKPPKRTRPKRPFRRGGDRA